MLPEWLDMKYKNVYYVTELLKSKTLTFYISKLVDEQSEKNLIGYTNNSPL
jgi:hypothetical protein